MHPQTSRELLMVETSRLEPIDCLIIGGGPAGLTAALYLARYKRRFLLVDKSRAEWIPTSHNIPVFAEGIAGPAILARQREHLAAYGVHPVQGEITAVKETAGGFLADLNDTDGTVTTIRSKRVLLTTGSVDNEPDLPDLPNAVQRGLVRYCPICDGFEASGKRIAVLGHGAHGMGEAIFIARTYSQDVSLLTLGQPMELSPDEQKRLDQHGIKVVIDPVTHLELEDAEIGAIQMEEANSASKFCIPPSG